METAPPLPPSAHAAPEPVANPLGKSPACPRCGYDQQGVIAAWGEVSCPIGGTCSECGLEFEWGDLLSPVRALTKLFEVDDRRRVRALVWTCWYALWCWPLWNRHRMHHPIRAGRIGGVMIAMLVLWYLFVAIPVFVKVNYWPIRVSIEQMLGLTSRWPFLANLFDFTPLIPILHTGVFRDTPRPVWIVVGLLVWLLMPCTFFLLPTSLRAAKVRHAHLFRGSAYAVVWILASLFLHMVLIMLQREFFGWWNGMPLPGTTRTIHFERMPMASALFAVIFAGVWWSVFAGRYLKLPHPWAIGMTLSILSLVLAIFFIWLLGGGGWLAWTLA